MRNPGIVGRWTVLGVAAIAALALSVGLIVRQNDTASAVCGANPCITIDADAATAAIQTNIVVATGANFDIALEASAIPAASVQGYQWQVGFDAADVNFVSATENSGAHGASLCAPPTENLTAPGGTEWWGNGAGCLHPSSTIAAGAVRLTTVTLQCDAAAPVGSTSPLHLVTGGDGATGEDPTFGTIFLGPGGTFVTTDLTDASVQCGVGAPLPTDTPPPAATPTNTPIPPPTNTPAATSTSLPAEFTRTSTPTGTAAPGTATVAAPQTPGAPPPGGASPTAPGGTTGGGGSGPITLPDTGRGTGSNNDASMMLFAAMLGAGLAAGAVALKLSTQTRSAK